MDAPIASASLVVFVDTVPVQVVPDQVQPTPLQVVSPTSVYMPQVMVVVEVEPTALVVALVGAEVATGPLVGGEVARGVGERVGEPVGVAMVGGGVG